MGKPKNKEKVKLICGMITQYRNLFLMVQERLINQFGKIDYESAVFPFTHTDYYEKEMGKELRRKFISFKELIKPENLSEIKIFTNNLEEEFVDHNNRRINLDPGYITLSQLILASTKPYYHRIYLGKGIYAEVTLYYKEKSFNPFPWTYPDYKTEEYIKIFNEIREIYKQQIKECKA